MTGRDLYQLWCGSAVNDKARRFGRMNVASQEAWNRLAGYVKLNEDGINLMNEIDAERERVTQTTRKRR